MADDWLRRSAPSSLERGDSYRQSVKGRNLVIDFTERGRNLLELGSIPLSASYVLGSLPKTSLQRPHCDFDVVQRGLLRRNRVGDTVKLSNQRIPMGCRIVCGLARYR